MAAVVTPNVQPASRSEVRETVIAERQALPIKIWAGIGGLVLAFEIFVITKWVTGPDFTPVHTGPTPVPGWMKAGLITMEVAFVALFLWCIWRFIIQPWRRDGRPSVDGLLCIGF